MRQTVEFHVSCSKPLALGDEFGSFKLVEFTTKEGTHVALGAATRVRSTPARCRWRRPGRTAPSDLEDITLVYIGNFLGLGCTVSNPQGGWATCTRRRRSGRSGLGDRRAGPRRPIPTDLIEFGDLVTISTYVGLAAARPSPTSR